MLNVPERITSVSHPLVSSIYLKKDYANDASDVLVIETNFSHTDNENDQFDSYLTELLGDLRELKAEAEKKVGHFDRVDIRTC